MQSLSSLALAGFAAFTLAAPVAAQRSDDQIQPKSVELMHQGQSLMAAGKLEDAENALETALAVDPRNRWAYVDIARIARQTVCEPKQASGNHRLCFLILQLPFPSAEQVGLLQLHRK